MKVRILVAVTEDGTWKAFGFGCAGMSGSINEILISDAFEHFEAGFRLVWVEAELPQPLPVPIVQGKESNFSRSSTGNPPPATK